MKFLAFQAENHIDGGSFSVRLIATTLSPEGYIIPLDAQGKWTGDKSEIKPEKVESGFVVFDTIHEAAIKKTQAWHGLSRIVPNFVVCPSH